MWDRYGIWVYILTVVGFALSIGVTMHAVQYKRDSRSVIAWVGLAWLAPMIGSLAYLVLGINRIQRKAVSLKLHDAWDSRNRAQLSEHQRQDAESYIHDYPSLSGLMSVGDRITGMQVVPGNEVEALIDGDEAYPSMLDAIAGARRSVALLSYIFDSDRAGDQFLEALSAAKQRGVEVRVLVDDVGSKYGKPNMVPRLKRAGLEAASFLPTRIPFPIYANMRNHRKILVVDGQVGFTGGTNIREGHWLGLEPNSPVQCLHFRLSGPVVTHLLEMFAVDWAFATGEVLSGDTWFTEPAHDGDVWARGIEHGPDEHFEALADVIASALARARDRVRIVTPYFLPNASLIQALNVTAMSGVGVEIYLPSANNIALVQWAATAQLWQMLEKGCRVYYTTPPFDHTKLMIVDDVWTLLGSTNWDPRSLRLNFEFNVECYNKRLAKSLNEIIDKKAVSAREVTLQEVDSRRFPIRLRDGLARLLTPYL